MNDKQIVKKRKIVFVGCLALILCIGVLIGYYSNQITEHNNSNQMNNVTYKVTEVQSKQVCIVDTKDVDTFYDFTYLDEKGKEHKVENFHMTDNTYVVFGNERSYSVSDVDEILVVLEEDAKS